MERGARHGAGVATVEPIENLATDPTATDDAGFVHDPKLLARAGLREQGRGRESSDRELVLREQCGNQSKPSGIAEQAKRAGQLVQLVG